MGDGAGLAGAGTGQDAHRPAHRLGGGALLGVQARQDPVGIAHDPRSCQRAPTLPRSPIVAGVTAPWDPAATGVLVLPGGRRCVGGVGRTGTALACLAVLDGVAAAQAVAFARAHYHLKAVETPWQRRWVEGFAAG